MCENMKSTIRHERIRKRLACSFFFLFSFFFLLSSCLGMTADISMRADGSGRIVMEYRFSHMAETVGRLDGNENWHIIPTGRADFERTVARIDGMRLVSFSSRETGGDIVNRVTLDFANTEALLKFLDPTGSRAVFTGGNGAKKLNLILLEPASSQINPELLALAGQVSDGCSVNISFSADKNSTLSVTDGMGRVIPPPPQAEVVSNGRKVSFSISTKDLLAIKDGLGLEILID